MRRSTAEALRWSGGSRGSRPEARQSCDPKPLRLGRLGGLARRTPSYCADNQYLAPETSMAVTGHRRAVCGEGLATIDNVKPPKPAVASLICSQGRVQCCTNTSALRLTAECRSARSRRLLADLRTGWLTTQLEGSNLLSASAAGYRPPLTRCVSGVVEMVLDVLGAQEAHLAKPPAATLLPRQDTICQARRHGRPQLWIASCLFGPCPTHPRPMRNKHSQPR